MRPIPEAADVTEADRLRCRALIEAASFYAVDYEDDGACWERVSAKRRLPGAGGAGDGAFWQAGAQGVDADTLPGGGTLGDETGPSDPA